MTQNQIAYANYLETKRSNEAKEAEQHRSNIEAEQLKRLEREDKKQYYYEPTARHIEQQTKTETEKTDLTHQQIAESKAKEHQAYWAGEASYSNSYHNAGYNFAQWAGGIKDSAKALTEVSSLLLPIPGGTDVSIGNSWILPGD